MFENCFSLTKVMPNLYKFPEKIVLSEMVLQIGHLREFGSHILSLAMALLLNARIDTQTFQRLAINIKGS